MYPGLPPVVACRVASNEPASSSRADKTEREDGCQDGQGCSQAECDEDGDDTTSTQTEGDRRNAPGLQRQALDPDVGSAGASSMLTVQYRMNSSIMQWSSDEMYKVRDWMEETTCWWARDKSYVSLS